MNTTDNLRLGLLPERKLNWRSLVASYGLLCLFILFIIFFGLLFPDRLIFTGRNSGVELIARTDSEPAPVKIKLQRRPVTVAKLLPPAVIQAPKLIVPKELRVVPKLKEVEAPKVVVNTFKPAVLVTGGARPAKLLYTGSFGGSAVATVNASAEKVQTGGFGDPNGMKGQGKDNASTNVAKLGGFDMPEGAGTGNGTGGANGVKGTIASAGFGSGVAQPGVGDGRSNGRGVQTGSFGSQEIAQGRRQAQSETAPTTPVEITYKPDPVYTEEAKQLRLEGEVWLEVTFGANGQLHVDRVVRGLGHGLDQAAVDAASKIRFKPALRAGAPVDSTAVVHVSFQMAAF
jgi:TonB family protein